MKKLPKNGSKSTSEVEQHHYRQNNTAIERSIIKQIDLLTPQLIESIVALVQIPSIKSSAIEDAPFGQAIKDALLSVLDLSQSMGLSTKNIDNYIGYAHYGSSEDYICAIGHLDVVEPNTGWKYPPFSATIESGKIIGRGVLDNKAPLLASLFGLYAIKKLNISLNKEIRVIFGCDEESGFEDVHYYLTKEKPPISGFTPDCKYPVVYTERGRASITITPKTSDIASFFTFINTYLLNTKNTGEMFGIAFQDPHYGTLELRNYRLIYNGSQPQLQLHIYYTAAQNIHTILLQLQHTLPNHDITLESNINPVYFDTNSALIQTLSDVYAQVTGLDNTPQPTSGGTYAKVLPNIVPFGPSFPGQKDISHHPNEWMCIEEIIVNAKIYALSLYRLAK